MSNPPGKQAGFSSSIDDAKLGAVDYGGTSKKKRKRPKGLVIGVAAAVALALGGGGALAATTYLGGDGTDPESRLPETTAAFATFNLDVSKEQQKQVLDTVAKFPSAAVNSEAPQEAVSQFLAMLEDNNDEFANGKFSEWAGPNASVALWENGDQPYGLITVSSIDDDKAKSGLSDLKAAGGSDQVGYELKDGYATIAFGEKGAKDAAKAAVAEAEDAPLSESERFAKADKFLGDDQVLSAWADLEQSYGILKGKLPEDGMGANLPFDALKAAEGGMKGQVAVGAKAQDFGIEAVSSTFGAENVVEGKKGMVDRMSDLPESDIAAALAVPEDIKQSLVLPLLETFTDIDPGVVDNVVLDKVFEALSGASGTLSLQGLVGATPSGKGVIETNSPQHAEALKALADLTGGALQTSVDGNTITGTTAGYSDKGKISDNPHYADAVGGGVDKLNGAAFFDMTKLLQGEAKQVLGAMKAIGVTHGTQGGEYVGNYRMIIE